MLLDYLVTSHVRRRVLRTLWKRRSVGSANDLAKILGISFSAVHRELERLVQFELVTRERGVNANVYLANDSHPRAVLLDQLLGSSQKPQAERSLQKSVRFWRSGLGRVYTDDILPLEETLSRGFEFAQSDSAFARPVREALWMNRNLIDPTKLGRSFEDLDTALRKLLQSPTR